jgi:hypothetical protein
MAHNTARTQKTMRELADPNVEKTNDKINANWRFPKKTFTFEITYYDEKGKFYRLVQYDYKANTDREGCPNMNDVAAHIRGLRDNAGQAALPGMDIGDDLYKEGWCGFIHICLGGRSILVLPVDGYQYQGRN